MQIPSENYTMDIDNNLPILDLSEGDLSKILYSEEKEANSDASVAADNILQLTTDHKENDSVQSNQ